MRLADMCPRLALARDQSVAWENARGEAIMLERENVRRLERLVAHRELQEVRACAACAKPGARHGAGEYLLVRRRKLVVAKDALNRARKRLRQLERAR